MVQLDILSNTFVRSIETNFISGIVYIVDMACTKTIDYLGMKYCSFSQTLVLFYFVSS